MYTIWHIQYIFTYVLHVLCVAYLSLKTMHGDFVAAHQCTVCAATCVDKLSVGAVIESQMAVSH